MPGPANSINESTTGIVGFTGTSFPATPVTNHAVIVGGSTSSTLSNVGPSATALQVLQSGGAAADPTYSTATYPATITQASYLYGSASNVVGQLAPSAFPAIGGFPTYDGTNGIWFNPAAYVYEWDDFITEISNTSLSKLCWQRMAVSGGNIDIPAAAQDSAHPGVVQLQITTGAGSGSGIILGNSNASPLIFGGGRCICNFWFKTSNISDVTDTYTTLIGFTASNVGTLGNNALVFSLNSGVNSGNWQMIAVKSGGGTTTASSSTGTDANWHKYTIDVAANGSQARFYIDGVELANSPVITANIPVAANQPVAPSCSILRTAGSTNARNAQVDLFTLWIALTSSR